MWDMIKEFKELIVVGVVLAILTFAAFSVRNAYVERDEFKAQLVVLKKQHEADKTAWGQEVIKWENQVERQRQELEDMKKKKTAIVQKAQRNFDDVFNKTKNNEAQVQNDIKANLKLQRNVVSVPAEFVRLYNKTVEGSRVAAEGGDFRTPEASFGLAEEVVTYDATTFTQVVVGNALDCVSLAVRHNNLVDAVTALENLYDANRPDGKAQEAGGDVPRRVVESLF